jgi:hypothetical protein
LETAFRTVRFVVALASTRRTTGGVQLDVPLAAYELRRGRVIASLLVPDSMSITERERILNLLSGRMRGV